jgi:hypothetical protein
MRVSHEERRKRQERCREGGQEKKPEDSEVLKAFWQTDSSVSYFVWLRFLESLKESCQCCPLLPLRLHCRLSPNDALAWMGHSSKCPLDNVQ